MPNLDPSVPTRVASPSTGVASSSEHAEWESLIRAAPPGAVITVIRIIVPTVSATAPPAGVDLDMKHWYTPAEVATRYRMQTRTIRTWVNEGRFPGHRRLPNGAIRIPVEDMDAVMARTDAAPGSDPASVVCDPLLPATGEAFDVAQLGSWRAHLKPRAT